MKFRIKSLCIFVLLNSSLLLSCCTIHAEDFETTVTIFFETYAGIFSGDLENNMPSGRGTFAYSTDDPEFTLDGNWKNGLLNGEAIIKYNNNSRLDANYKSGLISGQVTDYSADGSYKIYHCDKGKPYGVITRYSNNDKLLGYDFFYQMQSIADLKKDSITVDYNLLLNSTSYTNTNPLKIECTVLGVYDNSNSAYILAIDSKSHYYILTYTNNSTDKFNQAIVPNLSIGEQVTAYGFFLNPNSLSNIDNLGISTLITDSPITKNNPSLDILGTYCNDTLPFIRLFTASFLNTDTFNRTSPSYEYQDVLRNPFNYSGLECNLTGKILDAQINYSKQTLAIHLCESKTNNIYFLSYSFSENDILPATGNIVSISGKYFGNAKQQISDEDVLPDNLYQYILSPRIKAFSVSILQ